jgi:hypothetical protein
VEGGSPLVVRGCKVDLDTEEDDFDLARVSPSSHRSFQHQK